MNFFEDKAPNMRDMNISESFHRLKRTVLIFSSALILLALSKPSASNTLNIGIINTSMDLWAIKILLLAALIYYSIGFLFEVKISQNINSDALLGAGMKSIDLSMQKIAHEVNNYAEHLDLINKNISNESINDAEIKNIFAEYKPLNEKDLLSLIYKSTGSDVPTEASPSRDAIVRELYQLNMSRSESNTFLFNINKSCDELSKNLKSGSSEISELKSSLGRIHKDIGRISSSIYGSRRVSFWFWEVGGACAASLLAAVITIWSILKYIIDLFWCLY